MKQRLIDTMIRASPASSILVPDPALRNSLYLPEIYGSSVRLLTTHSMPLVQLPWLS